MALHNDLEGRNAAGAHPSTAISYDGTTVKAAIDTLSQGWTQNKVIPPVGFRLVPQRWTSDIVNIVDETGAVVATFAAENGQAVSESDYPYAINVSGATRPTSTPIMTSNTTPEPFVVFATSVQAGAVFAVWRAFDQVQGVANVNPGWAAASSTASTSTGAVSPYQRIGIKLDKAIRSDKLILYSMGAGSVGHPVDFTVECSNSLEAVWTNITDWTTVHTVTNGPSPHPTTGHYVRYEYIFDDIVGPYLWWSINITKINTGGAPCPTVGDMLLGSITGDVLLPNTPPVDGMYYYTRID